MTDHGLVASSTDPVSQAIVAGVILLLFVLLAKEAAHRVLISMACVAFVWVVSYVTPWHLIRFEASVTAIDMNVLVLLASMMVIVGVLRSTGAFGWAVGHLVKRARGNARTGAGLIAWFTGLASALLDNVTTVLFVTPMAIGLSRRMGLAPVAIVLPMVVASNIGGTATLIGDPPNVMIGSGVGLSFYQFIENLTAPVLIMMVLLQGYLGRYYRDAFASATGSAADADRAGEELADPVLLRWLAVVCGGVVIGFLTHPLTGMPVAVPALIGAATALVLQDVRYLRNHVPSSEERAHGILHVLEKDIEWPTLSFFVFLFILVGAAVTTGLVGSIAAVMGESIGRAQAAWGLSEQGTLLFAALVVCWVSAVLSAFIDNIPYVAVSIPVLHALMPSLSGETEVLWWALALGACLGGNATVIGASANVTTVGLAERGGVRITFAEYSRFAAPITAITIFVASAYLTAFVYLGSARAHAVTWVTAAAVLALESFRKRRATHIVGSGGGDAEPHDRAHADPVIRASLENHRHAFEGRQDA